jgi:hypothetical protein
VDAVVVVRIHAAQLQQGERASTQAKALLPEERRSRRREPYEKCQQRDERCHNDEGGEGEDDIQNPLCRFLSGRHDSEATQGPRGSLAHNTTPVGLQPLVCSH